MNNITKINNKKLIYNLAKKFDADLHAIDKIVKAWIYKTQNSSKGIIGFCKWDREYAIIDLFVPKGKNEKIMDSLVKFTIKQAIKDKISAIYCHMGDKSIHHFLNNGFIQIRERDMPKGYFCACTVCPEMNITCFPLPILWKNKAFKQ